MSTLGLLCGWLDNRFNKSRSKPSIRLGHVWSVREKAQLISGATGPSGQLIWPDWELLVKMAGQLPSTVAKINAGQFDDREPRWLSCWVWLVGPQAEPANTANQAN